MNPKTEKSNVAHIATQQYELVPIEDLKPHPKNARKSDQAALDASIAENGFYGAVVAQRSTGYVLAGWHRTERAKAAGIATLPVIFVDLPDNEAGNAAAMKIVAADNRVSDLADYDPIALAELLEAVKNQTGGFDGTGFDEEAYNEIIKQAGDALLALQPEVPDPEPQIDRAAELQKVWKTERGQLWLIGEHRLLCGDSTSADDVNRLMGNEKAGLMNTDPPYGVSYANDERPNPGVAKPRVAKPRVAKDDLRDDELQKFLEKAFHAAKIALVPNAAWYLWHAHLTQGFFAAAAAAAHVILHRQIIWVKPVLLLGRGQYHWKHEPCFMGWVKGQQPPDYGLGNGERTQTTIWEIGSVTQAERKEFNHATPKPVELFKIPIVKHLKIGEICYEPFAGSAPQFVAAEQLKRRCYGIEIDPRYVAVCLQRMSQMGVQAKLAK